MDRYPSSLLPVGLIGDETLVFISVLRDHCIYVPYLNSATSFIDIEYLLVLDPPEQLNMKPFRYSHCPYNFIGWGYVSVPVCCLWAVLAVQEGFSRPLFHIYTRPLAH